MLAPLYRFTILNQTGQTVSGTVKGRQWKYDSAGAATYSSESTLATFTNVTNNSYGSGANIDNAAAGTFYLGGHFQFLITAPASSSGNVYCYLERSTDGGTTWDTNGNGDLMAALTFSAAGTKQKSFEI